MSLRPYLTPIDPLFNYACIKLMFWRKLENDQILMILLKRPRFCEKLILLRATNNGP